MVTQRISSPGLRVSASGPRPPSCPALTARDQSLQCREYAPLPAANARAIRSTGRSKCQTVTFRHDRSYQQDHNGRILLQCGRSCSVCQDGRTTLLFFRRFLRERYFREENVVAGTLRFAICLHSGTLHAVSKRRSTMREMDAHGVEEEKGQGCVGANQIHPDDEKVGELHPANKARVRARRATRVHRAHIERRPKIIRGERRSQSPTARQAVASAITAARNWLGNSSVCGDLCRIGSHLQSIRPARSFLAQGPALLASDKQIGDAVLPPQCASNG